MSGGLSTSGSDDLVQLMAAAASNPDLAAAPQATGFLASAARAATFWRRAATVYGGYKLFQAKTSAARAAGVSEEKIKADWEATHTWAGAEMRDIALGLGGFYLKVGQLLSNRVDFVAPPVCKALAVLFDAVPPMPGAAVRSVIEAELGGTVESFFEELDLDKPIGSASIAQVRKKMTEGDGDGALPRPPTGSQKSHPPLQRSTAPPCASTAPPSPSKSPARAPSSC